MDAKILGVGPRTAAFLHETYPKPRAKLIARDFKVSTGTAERWLRGEAPTVGHIEQMTATFGPPYIRALFIEAFDQQDKRIKELEALSLGALVAQGVKGVDAGLTYIRSLFDQVTAVLGAVANRAGNLVGASPSPTAIEAFPENRMLLINGLIGTVPKAVSGPLDGKDCCSEAPC